MRGFQTAYGLYSALEELRKGKKVFAFYVNGDGVPEVRRLEGITAYQLAIYDETMEFYFKPDPVVEDEGDDEDGENVG